MAAEGALILDLDGAEKLRDPWDALAVRCGRPYCAPSWMLAWWRHAAPKRSALRIVAVLEGDDLAGIAPFFAEEPRPGLIRYRLLGSGASARVEPLASPGREPEIAAVVAGILSGTRPQPHVISFEGIDRKSPWAALLAEAWPGVRPAVHRVRTMPSPTLRLKGRTYDQWLAGIDRDHRKNIRRRRRRLEERGAVFRLAGSKEDMLEGLRTFAALHHDRWKRRGGSGALNSRIERMLRDVAEDLVEDLRFRLWSIEVGGQTISSRIFLAAGGELACWLGGFDQRWASFSPSIQALNAALQHAWTVGDVRMELGPGGQDYKYIFADGEDVLAWEDVIPRTPGYAMTRLRLAPAHIRSRLLQLRHDVVRRLSPQTKQRLKKALSGIKRRL